MKKENAIIRFRKVREKKEVILEIPLNTTANEIIIALNEAYDLGIDISDMKKCYLQCENPIVLLKGNKTLNEFGVRNGSIIYYTDREE